MSHPKKMLGLFKTAKGPGNMALRESSVPTPKANEVLIEVKAAGICGTDVHIRHDLYPYWPPVIMGHEFSGAIVEVGGEVTDYQVGDRVVAEPHTLACGRCELCRTGNIQLCGAKRSPGWGIHGAFARYLVMPVHLLHRIPETMSYEEGAVVEPAANVVHHVLERACVEPNDIVVVLGPGPIGLMALMAARAVGAGQVIIVGASEDKEARLPMAKELGADATVVAGENDPVKAVLDLTHGRGADLIVEASGSPRAIANTVGMVRRMGRISAIGLPGRNDIPFPWNDAAWKACTVIFNLSTSYTSWDRAIGLIAAKRMSVSKIITHVEPLQSWERAFEAVESKQALKVLLIP